MIRPSACRKKIAEIKRDLQTIGNSESQLAYKEHLRNQLKGWEKEYLKALERNLADISDNDEFYTKSQRLPRFSDLVGWNW